MTDKKKTVLVAMSGGVDSSTALHRILEAGYDAIGVTMKLWEFGDSSSNLNNDSNCCSIDSINNAKLVCEQLNVPHYTLDHQLAFRKSVVDNFVSEYLAGRTPNPCVRCNIFLKWGSLLEQARQMGAELIATGHYARITRDGQQVRLRKGLDPRKDQTYFLWGIDQKTLNNTLFPLGDLTKTEVRSIAGKMELPNAQAPESQEICFIPDNDYRRFLESYAPRELEKLKSGDFIAPNGRRIGPHKGIVNYTIGQRRGLQVPGPEPYYVQAIDTANGDIQLSNRTGMYFSGCIVGDLNWLTKESITNLDCPTVQIRYNHPGVKAGFEVEANGRIRVNFREPQFAVSPGQSAVFYQDDIVLGGGIIQEGIHD